jgi:type IV pilus assembly protein PilB
MRARPRRHRFAADRRTARHGADRLGKSTTLRGADHHQPAEVNIITVEDPVEYRLAGVNQVQINVRAGLTFASAPIDPALDPDVVMVGEIRDGETAKISIEAALTGHFVLSTLHTNDARARSSA